MKFLEFIKNQEEETTDLASFLKIFDEAKAEDLFVNISDTDTIKILTIHKAKGLEFPVVIIPFLKLEIQIGQGIQGTKPYVAEVRDNRIELIHLKKNYTGFSPKLEKIYRNQYQKILLSELNNIYVALTRAICELYAFVPARIGNQYNLARFLIPNGNLKMGEKSKYVLESHSDKEMLTLQSAPSGYRDWIDILKEEFQPMGPIANYKKLIKGEMMHGVLSCIERVFKGKEEETIQSALEESVTQFPSIPKDEARKFLTEVLRNEKLRPFFIAQDGQVFQEKEIVDQNGRTKRLDRLIIKKDEVWVIDYKSHREGGKIYDHQVKDYMQLVKELYPDHTIRGFLIYLDELDYEELKPINVLEDHAPIGRSIA
ncbi:MAG: 3'-5' exonuclease [Planctomycetota bacterium]